MNTSAFPKPRHHTPMGRMLSGIVVLLTCMAAVANEPASAPVSAQLFVTTSPSGAVVSCNGVPRDMAPLTIGDLPAGLHLIAASKPGYQTAQLSVELAPGQRLPVDLSLEPITGLLLLHSEPAGADVEIAGAHRGRTPLLLTDLPLGDYRARLSAAGYTAREIELHVPDRTPQRVDVRLASDSAIVNLDSDPAAARVLLNGIDRGLTPLRLDRIPQGELSLELLLDGYTPHRQTLRLAPGVEETMRVALSPLPAQLEVVSLPPGARVYVNDQFSGVTPVARPDLVPGEYRVRVELDGFDPMARSLVLPQAAKTVEEFRLVRNGGTLELTTEPAGVKVLVNGRERGITAVKADATDQVSDAFTVDPLPAGKHDVELTRTGYFPLKFTIELERDKTVTLHQKLQRRFIPNHEVRTPTEVLRGVLVETDPLGNVRLELRPGIIRTIPAKDVLFSGPYRRDTPQPE